MVRRGSILIVVLFVMAVVSLVALSLAYRAALISRLARDGIIRIQLRAQAESAVSLAMSTLATDDNKFDHPAESWGRPPSPTSHGWMPEWLPSAQGQPAGFSVEYTVEDEQGKVNVLHASSEALESLGLSKSQCDSLFDWMDADTDVRPEGAEQEYYGSLRHAYNCKNQPIESLEELLLVRGFAVEDYSGGLSNSGYASGTPTASSGDEGMGQRAGAIDYLTVWGDGRINLNTAAEEVLHTLPISEGAVKQILAYRWFNPEGGEALEEHVFQSEQDIDQLQGLSAADRGVLKDVATFQSRFFRIRVRCRHPRTGIGYNLSVLAQKSQNGPPQVLQWATQR